IALSRVADEREAAPRQLLQQRLNAAALVAVRRPEHAEERSIAPAKVSQVERAFREAVCVQKRRDRHVQLPRRRRDVVKLCPVAEPLLIESGHARYCRERLDKGSSQERRPPP